MTKRDAYYILKSLDLERYKELVRSITDGSLAEKDLKLAIDMLATTSASDACDAIHGIKRKKINFFPDYLEDGMNKQMLAKLNEIGLTQLDMLLSLLEKRASR